MQRESDHGKTAGTADRPPRRKRRKSWLRRHATDIVLSMAGLALAGVSGAFPFYVHRHPEKFGPPRMQYTGLTDTVPSEPEDRAPRFKEIAGVPAPPQLDNVITGTPRRPGAPPGIPNEPGPKQSFPGEGAPVSILRAIDGRAIVVDGGVINIVRPNSRLSDGSLVVDIRFNGKVWEIKTSAGKVFTWRPDAS